MISLRRTTGLAALLAVFLALPSRGEDAVAFRVQFAPGQLVNYSEVLDGTGELIRRQAAGDQSAKLDFAAAGRREWRFERAEGDSFWMLAASREAKAVLRSPGATYQDPRPWRAFRLRVGDTGRVLSADVVPPEELGLKVDDSPSEFNRLPVDLDLSEVLTMIEIGLLPPQPLQPGQGWSVAAEKAAPFDLRGRFVGTETADKDTIALLETTYSAQMKDLPTPSDAIIMDGSFSGQVSTRFATGAGRVRGAKGPLELSLDFRRRDTAALLATVNLKLNLAVTEVGGKPSRLGPRGGGQP